MNKQELIEKLEDIEWEDFDYYKITFPKDKTGTTAKTTTYTTAKTTTKGERENEGKIHIICV